MSTPSHTTLPSWVPAAAATAAAGTLALVWWTWPRANDPPGPRLFIPFIGEMPEFCMNPVAFMWSRYRRYQSRVFTCHLFGGRFCVVGDPELLRGPLQDQSLVEASLPISTFNQLVDLTVNRTGDRHKLFRKQIALRLSPINIKQNLHAFVECIGGHVNKWAAGIEPTIIPNFDAQLRFMVLDLALGPIAGLKISKDQLSKIIDLASTVQAGLFSAPIYFPGTTWYRSLNMRPAYVKALQEVAEQRFPPSLPGGVLRLEEDTGAAPGIDTTLALFQEFKDAGQSCEAPTIAERLLQNVLGATETTAGLSLSMVLVLAMLPEVQAKVRAEQAAVMQARGRALTWDVLTQAMPYTDAVVREAARLVPSAHASWRRAKKDLQLGPYRLPAGSHVMISFDLLASLDAAALLDGPSTTCPPPLSAGAASPVPREAAEPTTATAASTTTAAAAAAGAGEGCQGQVGPLPMAMNHLMLAASFKPERWMEGGSKPRYLHAFSYGPHSCLGKDLALMELKITLVHMARAGTWQLADSKNPCIIFVPTVKLASGPAKLQLNPLPL